MTREDGATAPSPAKVGREAAMIFTYEAVFEYSEDDLCWYVDFPAFQGDCFTDGGTIEEAAGNAADVLTLVICEYLDEGIELPEPTFHVPPRSIVCIDIDREAIERSKCLTYSQAAEELGISKARVCQLVKSNRLDAKSFDGKGYVTIASVNKRKANPPASHRPRRETPALNA